MKTVSVNIENLCVPCRCGCRHCLLSSQHRATGVDYGRGEKFARGFYDWVKKNRPELGGMYYVGYCMDFPELPAYIAYQKEQTGMEHLLFDGLSMRTEPEARELLREIYTVGAREIDLTFYGTPEYHDAFAGRRGDFAYLTMLARLALEMDIRVSAGVMLTRENMDQMETLFDILDNMPLHRCSLILPHAKGRGEGLSHLRLRAEDFGSLSPRVQSHFNRSAYRTETEWLSLDCFPQAHSRHLTLSLTPENIDRLECMDPAAIISELEGLDDAYYAALPSVAELARLCGQPENTQLFRFRDLYLQWQKRWWRTHPMNVLDMNDERHSFSVRVFSET